MSVFVWNKYFFRLVISFCTIQINHHTVEFLFPLLQCSICLLITCSSIPGLCNISYPDWVKVSIIIHIVSIRLTKAHRIVLLLQNWSWFSCWLILWLFFYSFRDGTQLHLFLVKQPGEKSAQVQGWMNVMFIGTVMWWVKTYSVSSIMSLEKW